MIILREPISIQDIQKNHHDFFDTMVKIVVDIERELLALNGEMHADLEEVLLEDGSEQQYLWGANIYFSRPHDLEFTSLINIRPGQGNKSMEVLDPLVRETMTRIVKKYVVL